MAGKIFIDVFSSFTHSDTCRQKTKVQEWETGRDGLVAAGDDLRASAAMASPASALMVVFGIYPHNPKAGDRMWNSTLSFADKTRSGDVPSPSLTPNIGENSLTGNLMFPYVPHPPGRVTLNGMGGLRLVAPSVSCAWRLAPSRSSVIPVTAIQRNLIRPSGTFSTSWRRDNDRQLSPLHEVERVARNAPGEVPLAGKRGGNGDATL